MKSVSIVIPAYNAAAFIENCINSALNQTYKNFEIIVVNDGSTDNTLEILERLKKKDSRIKIFSQKNAGVSCARNKGIKEASGELITFVDADDTLLENALEIMVNLMADDVDFVVCSHNEVRFKEVPYLEAPVCYNADELNDNFIKFDEVTWWPWGKMYRRSIIADNALEYDRSITFGEDHIFNLLYAKHIKNKTVVSDKIVYNYYYIRGGLCSKYYANMHELQKYVLLKIADYFDGNLPREYHKYYTGCYLRGCVDYYIAWLSPKKAEKAVLETIDIYSDLLDDEILGEYFTQKQQAFIKSKKIKQFIFDYTIHNPRKTIVRKVGRTARRMLEAIQRIVNK